MVDSQEVIERSIYQAIMLAAVASGYTLNPSDYLPVSTVNSNRFETDKALIVDDKGFYLDIFGNGNSESKGILGCPRIVIDPQAFFPGEIGLNKLQVTKGTDNYLVSEAPYDLINYIVDIHLVSNRASDNRLLHSILNTGIPVRGYIKPYTDINVPFDGNIFIELTNFYSQPNTDKGIMEKVYQFTVKDTLLSPLKATENITPINNINLEVGENTPTTILDIK